MSASVYGIDAYPVEVQVDEILGLLESQFRQKGRLWQGIDTPNNDFGMLGHFIVGLFTLSWIVSIVVHKMELFRRN